MMERSKIGLAKLCLCTIMLTALSAPIPAQARGDYQSPYSVAFTVPVEQLLAPNTVPPRGEIKKESLTPHGEWYCERIRRRYGAWGPEPRHYPAINNFFTATAEWKQQRLIAVAQSYIGLPYQHHHIPDWNPPESWPWKPVAYGRNSKGIDCSNFTSWIYNYGLGIKLRTAIRAQAYATSVEGAKAIGSLPVQAIVRPQSFTELTRELRPGDLLYIRPSNGRLISHVIMWLGKYGRSPDNAPLVIDCTGSGHVDSNRTAIPIGVRIRPFTPDSWYYKSFDHANRIL